MTTSPRITELTPVRRPPHHVLVTLDDDTTIETTLDFVLDEGFAVGDPVDEQLRARIAQAGLTARARSSALDLLAHRPRSRSELFTRLRRKEIPASIIDECLARLQDEGLIDDRAFARAYVRDRFKLKPRARKALLIELRRKGIHESMANAAIDRVLSEESIDEGNLARRVALEWLRRQGPATVEGLLAPPFSEPHGKARRKLHQYLARRGFGGPTLSDAIAAAVAAAKDEDGTDE